LLDILGVNQCGLIHAAAAEEEKSLLQAMFDTAIAGSLPVE